MLRSTVFCSLLSKYPFLNSEIVDSGNTVTVDSSDDFQGNKLQDYMKQHPKVDTLIIKADSFSKIHYLQVSTVKIQSSATELLDYFLQQNLFIKTVELPETITKFGTECFAGSSLQKITIPGTMTDLGTETFLHCYSLTELSIKGQIIPESFALECYNLTKVTITGEHLLIVTHLPHLTFPKLPQLVILLLNIQDSKPYLYQHQS